MPVRFTLVGRDEELEALLGAIDAAKEGRGAVVLLEGEPGIGKSRLMAEALEAASRQGMRTLTGSARELQTERPFGAFAEALQREEAADAPELAAIRDLLSSDSAAGEVRFRIVDLIFDLLERWSQQAPILLALEDLHWADASTLLVLDRIGKQAPVLPLLVLATARPSPRGRELALTLEEVSPHILRLRPLDPESSLELAAEALQARPGESLTRKLKAAGGNPLFEIELVAALQQEGAIALEGGVAEVADEDLPPSLRLTIVRRLGYLPEETLEVLRVASIFGSSFRVEHVARVAERSPVELLRAIEPARRSGTIHEVGDQLAFRHDLVRDAVYEDLPVGVRAGLHREVGKALLAAGASPVEAARHVSLGGTRGDREAVEILREAARQAAPRAPASAAEFLSRALELVEEGSSARAGILADLAIALDGASRSREAEARAREALAEPGLDEETAVRAAWGMIRGLGGQRRDRDAIGFLSRFLTRSGLPDTDRARLVLTRAQARAIALDLEGAEADLAEGRRFAERETDDVTRAEVLSTDGLLKFVRGRTGDALVCLDEAIALTDRSGAASEMVAARGLRSTALASLDRIDDAIREGRDLARLAEDRGLAGMAANVHAHTSYFLFDAGRWEEMKAEVETAQQLGGSGIAAIIAIRAAVAFHENDTKAAGSVLASGEALLGHRRPAEGLQGLDHVRALLHHAAGEPTKALAIFEELRRTRPGVLYDAPRWTPDAVTVALAAGDREAGAAFARLSDAAGDAIGSASARSAALRCRGLLQADPDLLLEAVAAGRDAPRPLPLALTLEDAARHTQGSSKAVPLLEEALEILDRLGADRHSRRVRAALRERGVRRGRPPSPGAKLGWGSLSQSERRVAELVAEGLRNRQIAERLFISIRTVESHLSSAFGKLGVSSRVELAAAVLSAHQEEG